MPFTPSPRLWLLAVTLLPLLTGTTVVVHAAPAPDDLDFAGRANWLLDCFRDKPIRGHQKTGLPDAVARLALSNGRDAQARAYLCKYPVKSDEFFDYPWIARAVHMWAPEFTPEELAQLRGNLARVHDWLSHGTENHAAMRFASAYLLAQRFPDAKWKLGKQEVDSAELMRRAKQRLLERGKGFFRIGNNEQLSPSYALLSAYPLLGLYDFADDPEVRRAAEALLTYHLATVAANSFDGHLMPPLNRRTRQMRFAPESLKAYRFTAIHHTMSWLLWGQNVVYPADFTSAGEPPFALFFALTTWRVPEPINRVARGGGTPYELRSVLSGFNEWGRTQDRETWRYLFRDELFAIGSPVAQRFRPRSFFIDYDMFSIAWRSTHEHRVIEATHPYWHSNRGVHYRGGLHSPFQQFAAHRNAAMVLFDIPRADPWATHGDERYWVDQRSRHIDDLLKVGLVRFPSTVTDLSTEGDWYFFRDGEVFLAVRALRPGHALDRDAVPGFIVIRSEAARTGFVFEVGTSASHGGFDAFRANVAKQPVSVDWDQLEASYTTTSGDEVRMRYNPSIEPDGSGWIMLAPRVWINGRPRELESWPLFHSPWVTLEHGVLTVRQSGEMLEIDWSGDLPRVKRSSDAPSPH